MSKLVEKKKYNFLLPVVLLIGLGLGLTRFLLELPEELEAGKIKPQHPSSYEFKYFDRLLKNNVKEGLFDYQSVKQSPGDLEAAYQDLKKTSPDGLKGKLEQLCFWINAYNLLAIKNVLEHYPQNGGKRINSDKYIIGAKLYGLSEIKDEHLAPLILSTNWKSIFLLCNGDLSAPEIADHAYTPGAVGQDTEAAFKKFVLSKNNYSIDELHKDFSISPFYMWNVKYFNEKYSSPFEMVNDSLPREQQLNLDAVSRSFSMPYDRRANDYALFKAAKARLAEEEKEQAKSFEEINKQTQEGLKQQIREIDLTQTPDSSFQTKDKKSNNSSRSDSIDPKEILLPQVPQVPRILEENDANP